MTDATREQIARDSKEFASTHLGSNGTYYDKETAFRAGAERQHSISHAAGLDDALRLIDQYSYGMTKDQWQDLTRKIEALKR